MLNPVLCMRCLRLNISILCSPTSFFRANTCFKTFSICGIVFIFATTNTACIAQCRREGGNPVETERAPSVQREWENESGISAWFDYAHQPTLNDRMNLKREVERFVETRLIASA